MSHVWSHDGSFVGMSHAVATTRRRMLSRASDWTRLGMYGDSGSFEGVGTRRCGASSADPYLDAASSTLSPTYSRTNEPPGLNRRARLTTFHTCVFHLCFLHVGRRL